MKAKSILIGLLALALPVWAEMSKEEREAYQAWYDANAAEDWPKAIEAGKIYRDSFPQGEYADYLKKWDRGLRVKFFADAVSAKKSDEMIKRGSDLLGEEPDDLDIIYTIAATLRVNELWAKPPVFTHAGEAAAFTLKAAHLIEAGKIPTNVDAAKWDKEATLGTLYSTLAFIEKTNKNTDKAVEYYLKAAEHEPSDANHWLSAGIQSYLKYQEAARRSRDPANTDATAKGAAEKYADLAIKAYTGFLKATANEAGEAERRAKVEKGLADAYKFRHPDAPDDWKKALVPESPAAPVAPPPPSPPPSPAPETKAP
jgi:tetratricopeptide (TPR) repeat protein